MRRSGRSAVGASRSDGGSSSAADVGFDVRYSGWIDPYRADSSIAMGRNAAWWTSTSGPPDDSSATVWHRDIATDRNSIWRSAVNVTYWLAVRCVGGRDS